MERLTRKLSDGTAYTGAVIDASIADVNYPTYIGEAVDKLAAYEDAEEQWRILPAPLDGVERFTLDGGKTIWQRVYEPDMTEEGTAMTENEAKDILNEIMELDDSMAQYNLTYMKAMEVAIKALGEVQQYRKYKNKFREIYGDCEDALDVMLDLLTKYEMPELNGKADYKLRLLTDKDADKWDAYRTIGTPEECRAAMEKQPVFNMDKVVEQLQKISDEAHDLIMVSDSPQYYDGYEDGVDKAIDIVKAGGVDGKID